MAKRWYWQARLEDEKTNHFMVVQINACPEEEAYELAERQNQLFAVNYNRDPYVLRSMEKMR
jgi:hypothetical protein